VYRRVFGFRKYYSVRMFIAGTGRLDFAHLRLLSVLRFIMRPSSLGGGLILRRTLSVCLSVRLSVRPSRACLH